VLYFEDLDEALFLRVSGLAQGRCSALWNAFSVRALLLPLILFIVGFALRYIPETMVGQYPIGNDTIVHYAPYMAKFKFDLLNMVYWGHLTGWPLMKAAYAITGDPFVALKIVGPILYGFLLVSFYSFVVSFDYGRNKSALITLFLSVQIPMLRLSWDLFHNVLGLCFMFLAFGELQRLVKSNETSWSSHLRLAVFCILTALTHQMTFFVLVVVTVFLEAGALFKKESRLKARNIVKSMGPSLILFFLIVTLPRFGPPTSENPFQILYRESLMEQAAARFFVNYLDFLSYFELLDHVIITFAVAFAPLLPFAVIGYKRKRPPALIRYYTLIVILCTFSPLLFGISLFHWDRWMWLLAFPVGFYAFNGIWAVEERISSLELKRPAKSLLKSLFVSAIAFSFGFLCFVYVTRPESSPFALYNGFPSMWYLPETMRKTSIPFENIPDLLDCVKWLDVNARGSAAILFGSQFSGYLLLNFTPKDNVTLVSYDHKELDDVLEESLSRGFRPIYVIWWSFYGTPDTNQNVSFLDVYGKGFFSIYGVCDSFEPVSAIRNESLLSFRDGKYVEVPGAGSGSLCPSVFTIEFWAKPSNFSKWNRWMGKSFYASDAKSGWEIMWTNDVNSPSICLAMWDEHNTERRSSSVKTELNEWTHVAFTFNGSHLFSFRDGKLNGTVDTGDWRFSVSLEPFRVGSAFDGSLYNGLFASLRFYDRSLSSYEIAHNLFGNGTRDGLVLEFDFIDNGSLFLPDMSGLGNNGAIVTD